MTPVVGIDPGLQGYVATLYDDGEYALTPLPREGSVLSPRKWAANTFLLPADALVVVEQQFGKGRGAKTVLTNYGALLHQLRVAGFDPYVVGARTWKKHFGLTNDKAASVALVKKKRKDIWTKDMTHDAAEAVLLALYGQEVVRGTE